MKNRLKNNAYPVLFFIVLLLAWEGISRLQLLPPFILPAPVSIIVSLVTDIGYMAKHIGVTVYETAAGFLASVLLAVIVAVLMDALTAVKKTIFPLLVISQTIPIIILAPLFIIWFGYGYFPKIIIVILICFFPISISLQQGLASTDRELIDLLRSMGASRVQIYRFVKIPSAMPDFFSGLKIAATYSIMGATIGEWVGGKDGLGVYMIRAKQSFSTDKVFGAIAVIVVLSIALLKFIEFIENKSMPWLKTDRETYIEE